MNQAFSSKLILHPGTAAQLEGLLNHPAGSVIFHGPPSLGPIAPALELAALLPCRYPDLIRINRGDKPSLGIEQVRGLITELALRTYTAGATRVAIIEDAHLLTPEAQNALLKLLEEPPPATLIILVADNIESLLPTVRSRCRAVRFLEPAGSSANAGPGANTAAAERAPALEAAVNTATTSSLFEKLLLATRLAGSGADLQAFGEELHHRTTAAVAAAELDPPTASRRLAALETYRTQLAAKVSPRVALERLMLELG